MMTSESYHHFDLSQWLYWLEHRHEQGIQLGLGRVRKVYQSLAIGKPAPIVITVAGTNGKGSVVSLLESIYTASNYLVGAYTSPHLLSFNERIRLNQHPVSDQEICEAFTQIESMSGDDKLTYFEMVTVAALLIFAQRGVDIAILEVGLGGRLDAVNIIDADYAVITSIDFDHQDYLGDNLDAIAAEKAGIIRSGKPVVFGDRSPQNSILTQVRKQNCPFYYLGESFDYQVNQHNQTQYQIMGKSYVLGSYLHPQACATALMVTELLNVQIKLDEQAKCSAVSDCQLAGRLEYLPGKPSWLLDVSHNEQAVERLVQTIQHYQPVGQVRAVFGVFRDKPYRQLIELMANLVESWYIAPLKSDRSATGLELFYKIRHYTNSCKLFDTIEQGCAQVAQDADETDLVVVFGSFLTVQSAKCYFASLEGKNK